jgi:hypothetical protein
LIGVCASRLPGATLVFDAVPAWMAGVVGRGTAGYQPPPLPWTLGPGEMGELASLDPAVVEVRDVPPPAGRGLVGWLVPKLAAVPVLRNWRPVIVAMRFRE